MKLKFRYLFLLSVICSFLIAGTAFAAPSRMADGGFFDANYYAQTYPDVAAALGTDSNILYQHYVTSGQAEGRLPYAPNAINPSPLVSEAPNFKLTSYVSGVNLAVGETITLEFNIANAVSSYQLNYQWKCPEGYNVEMNWIQGAVLNADGTQSMFLTIKSLAAGNVTLNVYWYQNPSVIVTFPITMGLNSTSATTVTPNNNSTSVDGAYLVATDFNSIRNQYITATPLCGYALPYIGSDGKSYVMTVVYYKIIDKYHDVFLHNLTDNTLIKDPSTEYANKANRSYGAGKITNLNRQQEVLQKEQEIYKALQNILETGVNTGSGVYASPEYIASFYQY